MKNVLLAISIVGALIGGIILSPDSHTSASELTSEEISAEEEEINVTSLIQALKKAEAGIEDDDLRRYYTLLIQKYNLEDNISINTTTMIATDMLPDIDHIVRTSVTLPLIEAGDNIQDEDIKGFYERFLEDVGWEFAQ